MEEAQQKIKSMGYDPDNLSDEERGELMKKLDKDLDDFVEESKQRGAAKSGDVEEKSIEQITEELTNHPAFLTEIDYTKPLSDEVKGLIALKYESEDPFSNATSYKDEGNHFFKKKDYKLATENYTEGIKIKAPDKNLNAVLYSNRAACHYHRQNYRSSLNDAVVARKFKPDHLKAFVRGALCCLQVSRYSDCIKWCESGLLLDKNHKELSEIICRAEKLQRTKERDIRKEAVKERKEQELEKLLIECIKGRGIQLSLLKKSSSGHPLLINDLEANIPRGSKVHLDEDGILYWPVLFMYPEHQQTDFIDAFNENDSFQGQIGQMFGSNDCPPSWDSDGKYSPEKIEIYFENRENEKLHKVKMSNTLLKILQHKHYVVDSGTPTFLIIAKDTKFREAFLNRYGFGKS